MVTGMEDKLGIHRGDVGLIDRGCLWKFRFLCRQVEQEIQL